ncbi:MAG: trigger factor, partial [Alphaproteobacteria bacterium]|nr:trigger factor [Alphaproteobacteria bacterium]
MQVKQLKHDGLLHEMEVTLPATEIDAHVDRRLQEVGKTVRMAGFRAGKVPLAILKKRYGKAVMGEVLEQAVNESSAKALSDQGLRPAFQPKIEVKSFDEGKDLTYTLEVEVLPTFKLAEFKGVKLERLVTAPEDSAVDEAIAKLADNHKSTKPITGKRAAKEGDTLVIDFDGRTADDDKRQPGMKAEGHHLELGSGMFIPGFEDQLIGKKAGEDVEVRVEFPANYGSKELAGRAAIFDVKIHEIQEPSEAEINDEFAQRFGLADVAALKDAVRGQLEQEFANNSRLTLKKSLLDFLDEAHKFDVPLRMLGMEHDNIMRQVENAHKREGKADLTDAEKAEFKDIAERRVRLGLILSEIGRQNNLSVSDVELQKAVIAEAQKYPGQERQVFDYYAKNRNALESFRAPL